MENETRGSGESYGEKVIDMRLVYAREAFPFPYVSIN
jgi:hypothetical protein